MLLGRMNKLYFWIFGMNSFINIIKLIDIMLIIGFNIFLDNFFIFNF